MPELVPEIPLHHHPLFRADSPVHPIFVSEAVRTLMCAMPLTDDTQSPATQVRRMFTALQALAALGPRNETELMLGVQAVSAYQSAAKSWWVGMNLQKPGADRFRHINAAATAARTFDTMLKAIERRQAKPLAPPVEAPRRLWEDESPTAFMAAIEQRCLQGEDLPPDPNAPAEFSFTPEQIASTEAFIEERRIEKENEGLDIANTEGILPGGGMILTEDPTPQQIAYMGRRLGLMYRREYQENLRKGIRILPKLRPIRPGDLIP